MPKPIKDLFGKPVRASRRRRLDPAEEAEILRRAALKEVCRTQVTVMTTLGFFFVRIVGKEKREAQWLFPEMRLPVTLGIDRAVTYKAAVDYAIHAAQTELKNKLAVELLARFDTRLTRQMLHECPDES